MEKLNLPITGICSFAKYPIVELENLQADMAILGVPYDIGVGFLSGARLGPRRIREISTHYGRGAAGFYDPERDETYLAAPWRVVDCGDADIVTGDIHASFAAIESAVRRIVDQGVIPVVIGGDHSISIPVARALSDQGPLTVVQFDAHLDWSKGPGPQRFSNGTPMRHMSTMPHIKAMTQIGMRGLGSSNKDDFEEARVWGSKVITCREALELGVEGVMKHIPRDNRFYVTIDIDSLDISIAAGVGSPSPGGFSFTQLLNMLEALSRLGEVVCFDFVEVAPQYDHTETTTRVAAMIMLYFMGFIQKQRERAK
jgi:agmatinase